MPISGRFPRPPIRTVIINERLTLPPPAQYLLPVLFDDSDLFYATTVLSALTPDLVIDTDTFFAADISQGQILAASLVTDTDNFYAPTLVQDKLLAASLVTDTDSFFSPTVSTGSVTLAPSLVTDADNFYAPAVARVLPLAPGLVVDTDIFYAPIFNPPFIDVDIFYPFVSTVPIIPIWYREGDTIYAISLVQIVTLRPPVVDAPDAFFAPIVGARTLLPPFLNADAVITPPTVAKRNPVLPPLVTSAEAIFTPTVTRGPRTLLPSRVIDLDIIRSPIVGIELVTPNPPGGDPSNLPGNLKYVSRYAMTQSGLILSMDLRSSTAKTVNTRMLIYRETGGLPGALAGVTTDKTSVVSGINHYTLIAPVSVLNGDNIWMGLHSDGNFNWFLNNQPNGSKWNTDTWVGGASDPFGPVNNDNKKAPIVFYYLASSNASITVDKVIDTDLFYAPVISQINILRPSLVTEEFYYTPLVRSQWTLAPSLVEDIDLFYAPSRSGTATIRPPLLASDDVIYGSFVATHSPQIFSAPMPNDDEIYPPTVVLPDTRLLPQRVVDTDVFYAPTRSSSKTLLPPVVTAPDAFFTPVVSKGAVTLLPPLIGTDLDIFTPEITTFGGPETIAPQLVTDLDVFYPPSRVINKGWRRQVYILGDEDDDRDILGVVPTPELESVE